MALQMPLAKVPCLELAAVAASTEPQQLEITAETEAGREAVVAVAVLLTTALQAVQAETAETASH